MYYQNQSILTSLCTNLDKVKPNGLTKEQSWLLHHVLVDALPNVLPLAVHLGFFWWTSRGELSKIFFLFEFFFAGQVGGTTLNLSYSLRFIVGPLLHA